MHKITPDLLPLAVPIKSIKPDPANPREAHDVDGIAKSFNDYGQCEAIVVNKTTKMIEAGHGRLYAALKLGWSEIAVNFVDHDDQQAIGYNIAANRLSDLSRFNDEALLTLLQSLDNPLDVPGIDDAFMAELLENVGGDLGGDGDGDDDLIEDDVPIDKAEELLEKWQCEAGQLWTFDGKHRLIVGDCTDKATVERLMGGKKANVIFTSPPYAMQRKDQYGGVETDKYVAWWEGVQANARRVLADDGSFFVNIKPHCENGERVLYVMDLVLAMKRQWGWRYVDELIWKHQGVPGLFGNRLKNQFEPIYHFCKNDCKTNFDNIKYSSDSVPNGSTMSNAEAQGQAGDHFTNREGGLALPGNVIVISTGNTESLGHSAAFPTALPTFFIKAYSDPNDIIFDPFMGSGTTMAAAYNEGRIGVGTERLPKYASVILERMSLLGLTPELSKE